MKTRRLVAFLLMLVLLVGVAGSAMADKIKLGWYFPVPHPYGEEVRKGVEQFAEDYKDEVDVTLRVGTGNEATVEQTNIEGMVAQGIMNISMFSSDTVSVNTLADEMDFMGVNLGLYGGGAQQPTKTRFVVATDLKESARLATEFLIEQMGGSGNIIICLEGIAGASIPRREGILESVAAHPGVTIIQEVVSSTDNVSTAEGAAEKILNAVSAHADEIDGFITCGFNPTVGAITAFSEFFNNGGKHIPVVGIDIDPNIEKALQDEIITGTLVQNSAAMGYISMTILKYMAEGWKVQDGVYEIDSGCCIVTKDNMNDYQPDLDKVRDQILSELTTKYLVKK